MKDLQNKVGKFTKGNGLESPIEHQVLDIMSELGEVAKDILEMSDYGRKEFEYREEIKQELGDVLYCLIKIANYFDVDLEDALKIVLEKYEKRLEKGSAGSEND